MKTLVIVLIVVLVMTVLYYLYLKMTKGNSVSINEARMLIETKTVDVIDVRTPIEFESGHVEGAKLIDVNNKDFGSKVSKLDRDKSYLVYCKSGMRSAVACRMMKRMGFTKAYNMRGGYSAWTRV